MLVWSFVGLVCCCASLITGEERTGEKPGDKNGAKTGEKPAQPVPAKLKGRLECEDDDRWHFPTHKDNVCDKLQLTLRNRGSNPFPGGKALIVYSNKDDDVDVEITDEDVVLPVIEADESEVIDLPTDLTHPSLDSVACDAGFIKVKLDTEEGTVIAKKAVLPNHDKCQDETDGDIELAVEETATAKVTPMKDAAGNYYVALKDMIKKINVKGKLKQKLNSAKEAIPYKALAFLRKLNARRPNGWMIEGCSVKFTPEAMFGDAVFQEFDVDKVDGSLEIFSGGEDAKVYITGPMSACPAQVCGKVNLVVYFDWFHTLDNFPEFDTNKCNNFYTMDVDIDCEGISKDEIKNTQVMDTVPDFVTNGRDFYTMSCNGYEVQFDKYDARENIWMRMEGFVKNSQIMQVSIKRMERFVKAVMKKHGENGVCVEAQSLDSKLDEDRGLENENPNCKEILKEVHEFQNCQEENCLSAYHSLLMQAMETCENTRAMRGLCQMLAQLEDGEGLNPTIAGTEADNMQCPEPDIFNTDDDMDEAESLKSRLEEREELNVDGEGPKDCTEYMTKPMQCAQRIAAFIFNSAMAKYWNGDFTKDRRAAFCKHNKMQYGSTDMDSCKDADITKPTGMMHPQFFAVKDGKIWKIQRNSLFEKPYCPRLIAVHRCPKCEVYANGSKYGGSWSSYLGRTTTLPPSGNKDQKPKSARTTLPPMT